MAAHVTEHVAFQYRREIEKTLGVEMPNEDKPLPEDVEAEVSRLAKEAAEKLHRKIKEKLSKSSSATTTRSCC